jgi:DnaK suppressor protein
MDAQTMEHLRTKLLNRREMWLGRRGRLLAEQQGLAGTRPAEWNHLTVAQTEAARPKDLGHLETEALERIEASLDRIEKGTYGKCLVCRGAIETERLRAMPDVTRCAGCTH